MCLIGYWFEQKRHKEEHKRHKEEQASTEKRHKEEHDPSVKMNKASDACSAHLKGHRVSTPKIESKSFFDDAFHNVPQLRRSDAKSLELIQGGSFLLFVGPSGFGKSTTVHSILSSSNSDAVYVPFRKTVSFWEDLAKAFGVPFGKETTGEFVLNAVKEALLRRKAKGMPIPIFFFDDIHNVLMEGPTTLETIDAASHFFTWLLEQHISAWSRSNL